MRNDPRSFKPFYLSLLEDMKKLSRLHNPSYLGFYEQLARAVEPMRKQHLDFLSSFSTLGLATSRFQEVASANSHWLDLIKKTVTSTSIPTNLQNVHQSWLSKLLSPVNQMAHLQATAQLSLANITHLTTITERRFAGFDFESLRRAAEMSISAMDSIQTACLDFTASYERFASSISMLHDLLGLPSSAVSGASRELFTTSHALNAIVIDDTVIEESNEVQLVAEVDHETMGCITLLQNVNPALARPYIGAQDAFKTGNTDRARHVLASLRELWNHLLRQLAPDDEVNNWIPREATEFLHEGRPTRKARILYICRNIDHDPLSDFLVQDTRALVKLGRVNTI